MTTFAILFLGVFNCVLILALAIIAVRYWSRDRNSRAAASQGMAIYPGHRGLFRFSDGVNIKELDPIQIMLDLEAHPKYRLDKHPKLVLEGDEEAFTITIEAVRAVFGVPPFKDKEKPGLTARECLGLLDSFFTYVDSQKKSIDPSPTSPPSMDATSSESGKPITSDTLGSGSTEAAQEPSRV